MFQCGNATTPPYGRSAAKNAILKKWDVWDQKEPKKWIQRGQFSLNKHKFEKLKKWNKKSWLVVYWDF